MERAEITVYDSNQLKNKWEMQAQAEKAAEEAELARREKSALNGLFKQWQVKLAIRSGVAPGSEKKGKELSDFRKFIVKADPIELSEEEMKLKALAPPPKRAPIAPESPPRKLKQLPPPPKPAQKEKTPPKRPVEKKPDSKPALKKAEKPKVEPKSSAQPKIERESKPVRQEETFGDGWGQSWKMLKSPLHQQTKQGAKQSTTAKPSNYKAMGYNLEKKWGSPVDSWKESWKHLKKPTEEKTAVNKSLFETMSEGKWWRSYKTDIENVSLSDWAGTWKTVNVVLGQTEENWNQEWERYKHVPGDKLKTQTLEEKVNLPGWEESWKSSKPEHKQKVMGELKIPNVFLPGWNDSWKTSDKCIEHNQQPIPSMKDWRDSWKYSEEHKWCLASMKSRHRHYVMMMSKRKLSNNRKGFLLDHKLPAEWMESWKAPKPQQKQQEPASESGLDMSNKPMHLQFHKINTPFPDWCESWRACANVAGKGGDESSKKWQNSWKLSVQDSSAEGQGHTDVVCFSTKHKTHRFLGVKHTTDAMPQSEWSESWKTTKTSPLPVPQPEQGVKHDDLSPVVSLFDWGESWKSSAIPIASGPRDFRRVRVTGPRNFRWVRWVNSWRLSNPNQQDQQDEDFMSHSYRHPVAKHHRYLQEAELPAVEWTSAWKYHMLDSKLDTNMTREESGEWGHCWRVLNPQVYMKKESWCEQVSSEDSKDLRLQLTFLSKDQQDKKIMNLDLSSSEWNESWKLQKEH